MGWFIRGFFWTLGRMAAVAFSHLMATAIFLAILGVVYLIGKARK